ncbi:TPR repeat region-containing protein [Nocardiopsis suaedae]|uniref:TPR repeat domain-containing protein n=1 Tax=Nocardiopsis suaedae TaxID=3018444 RepID=A0ABT4TEW5_9ACTN|nr:hypothetical protein [Nocardiopsis suaedae]MDA2803243.1 hypothetical protein [Nocardiopsis suaedae]
MSLDDLETANNKAWGTFFIRFAPKKTEARKGKVQGAADDLEDFASRLRGGSVELGAEFDSASVHVTDAIKWQIGDLSNENQSHWIEAAYGVSFVAKEMSSWADVVGTFNRRLLDLIDQWAFAVESAVNQLPGKKEYAPSIGHDGDILTQYDEVHHERVTQIINDLKDKRDAYTEQNNNHWEDYRDAAEAHAKRIGEGATDANVRRLIEAGYMGWSAFNLKPESAPFPIDPEQAEEDAKKLAEYHGPNAKEKDAEYWQALQMLQLITGASGALEGKNNQKASVEYLENLFAALNEHSGREDLLTYLVGDADDPEAAKAFGEGILTLSDERYGGSLGRLPEDIRNAVNGPSEDARSIAEADQEVLAIYTVDDWARDVPNLAYLFESADPHMRGGTELSARLTAAVGSALGDNTFKNMDLGEKVDDLAGDLLDVSFRNIEANYDVLTDTGVKSKDNLDGREFTAADVLKGLFTYEWEDDGETARGLIDWIAEDAAKSGEEWADERERAGEAAAHLIDTLTTDPSPNSGEETGGIFGDLTAIGGKDDPKAMGEINPELSASFGGIFESYIEDFGGPGFDQNMYAKDVDPVNYPWAEDGNVLMLTPESRAKYMQLVVGDEEAGAKMFSAIESQRIAGFVDYYEGDSLHGDENSYSGRLSSLFDAAVANHGWGTYGNANDAYTYEVEMKQAGGQMLIDETVGRLGSGILTGLYKEGYKEIIESVVDKYDSYPETLDDMGYKERMSPTEKELELDAQLSILGIRTDAGEFDVDSLDPDLRSSLNDGDGGLVGSTDEKRGQDPTFQPGAVIDRINEDVFGSTKEQKSQDHQLVDQYVDDYMEGYREFGGLRADSQSEYKERIDTGRR